MSRRSFLGNGDAHAELDTASFFRWSMKTCRLTSSVRIGAPASCCDTKAKQQLKKKHLSNLKAFLYDIAGLTITLITFLSPRWSHISSEVPFEPHILRICCSLQFKTLRFDSICQRHRKALGFQHSIWMKEGNNASSEINFRTRVLCMKMCGSPNTVPAPSHTGCCESVKGWPWTAGTEPVSHRVLCQRIWAWGNAPARSPRHHPGEPAAAV